MPVLSALIHKAEIAEARIITRVISPQIDLNLPLSSNNRHIAVAGHIQCDAREHVRIDVTITQDTTGVQAKGHTQMICSGAVQHWTALAVARGRPVFGAGRLRLAWWQQPAAVAPSPIPSRGARR